MKTLEILAKTSAVLAGVLLTAITLMTCISLVGRNTTGWTIVGDVEISGFVAGAAIALFLPWCQIQRGNIIVDFFTAKVSVTARKRLDRLGALLLGLTMALMTWRTAVGAVKAWESGSASMMMGLPEWTVYVCMVPALALTTAIALAQAARGFHRVAVHA